MLLLRVALPASCGVSSITTVNFGAYDVFSPTALDSLDGLIVDAGYERLLPWTRYRFAYAVDRGGVDAVLPVNDELIRRTVGRSA